MAQKTVDCKAYPLKELFLDKFDVDFYDRKQKNVKLQSNSI